MHVPAEIDAFECLEKHHKLKSGELTEEDLVPKPFSNPLFQQLQKQFLSSNRQYTKEEALNLLRRASGLTYNADDIDKWKEWLIKYLPDKYPLKVCRTWLEKQQ